MDRHHEKANRTPTPCFCHEQANGKKCRINNAKQSQRNNLTRQSEKLVMANAMAPAAAAKLLLPRAPALRAAGPGQSLAAALDEMLTEGMLTGGEEMPNAFKKNPIIPKHVRHNIVAATHPVSCGIGFWQVYAALFGFESAICSFGRWPAIFDSAEKRMSTLL